MECRGEHFWAGERHAGLGDGFTAIEAKSGVGFGAEYREASVEQVHAAVAAASSASRAFAATTPAQRAAFLRKIADNLEQVYAISREEEIPTNEAAARLAERRLAAAGA